MSTSKTMTRALSAALISLAPATALAQNISAQAGVAAAVRGDVTLVATMPAAVERAVGQNLSSGDKIFLGDVIETGPQAGMQIMLLDETIFTIGPNAGLIIDTFVYDPATSAGQVTATVLKGAFRFVSGRVAKKEPRNMNVQTPAGTIGIRGTSAAGRVYPPDANGVITAEFVLLGPGAENNASERAGRIIVTNGDTSVEISRSGFGTTVNGQGGIPTPPVRINPIRVGALTGGLGTNGGAQPGRNGGSNTETRNTPAPTPQNGRQADTQPNSGQNPGPFASGRPVQLASATRLSGQNLGVSGIGAANLGQIGGQLNTTNRQLLTAAEEASATLGTAIATFDQLRTIQSGTATFNFGTVTLNHISGPHTNSGGSFDATATIDFGARSLDLTVSNVSYFFNGGAGQLFVFNPTPAGDISGTFDTDTGTVAETWNSGIKPDRFPTLPTDGATAEVSAAILNDLDAGVIAANGRVSVTINNGTDVVSGSHEVAAQ